jgi:hypothetical protein
MEGGLPNDVMDISIKSPFEIFISVETCCQEKKFSTSFAHTKADTLLPVVILRDFMDFSLGLPR